MNQADILRPHITGGQTDLNEYESQETQRRIQAFEAFLQNEIEILNPCTTDKSLTRHEAYGAWRALTQLESILQQFRRTFNL